MWSENKIREVLMHKNSVVVQLRLGEMAWLPNSTKLYGPATIQYRLREGHHLQAIVREKAPC